MAADEITDANILEHLQSLKLDSEKKFDSIDKKLDRLDKQRVELTERLDHQDLDRRFQTEEQRLQYLFDLRFADVTCRKCKRRNSYHRHPVQARFTCTCGDSQIYPRKGTIFESSPLPLGTWFLAVSLLFASPQAVSARELERKLNVTYATAWRMRKKIQEVMPKHNSSQPLSFDAVLKRCILPEKRK